MKEEESNQGRSREASAMRLIIHKHAALFFLAEIPGESAGLCEKKFRNKSQSMNQWKKLFLFLLIRLYVCLFVISYYTFFTRYSTFFLTYFSFRVNIQEERQKNSYRKGGKIPSYHLRKINATCFRPGSNRGPCACEAHVITATLRKLSERCCRRNII